MKTLEQIKYILNYTKEIPLGQELDSTPISAEELLNFFKKETLKKLLSLIKCKINRRVKIEVLFRNLKNESILKEFLEGETDEFIKIINTTNFPDEEEYQTLRLLKKLSSKEIKKRVFCEKDQKINIILNGIKELWNEEKHKSKVALIGGTSLSKVYSTKRFSEDIDLSIVALDGKITNEWLKKTTLELYKTISSVIKSYGKEFGDNTSIHEDVNVRKPQNLITNIQVNYESKWSNYFSNISGFTDHVKIDISSFKPYFDQYEIKNLKIESDRRKHFEYLIRKAEYTIMDKLCVAWKSDEPKDGIDRNRVRHIYDCAIVLENHKDVFNKLCEINFEEYADKYLKYTPKTWYSKSDITEPFEAFTEEDLISMKSKLDKFIESFSNHEEEVTSDEIILFFCKSKKEYKEYKRAIKDEITK